MHTSTSYIQESNMYLDHMSFYPCKGMLLVVVLHMYIPLYILAQRRALESTVAISLKSAN